MQNGRERNGPQPTRCRPPSAVLYSRLRRLLPLQPAGMGIDPESRQYPKKASVPAVTGNGRFFGRKTS
ncbi:hypothetical protein KNP414_06035 [Paenibacillus mucilaginosus KNP414]|uniref:Uncharacterized protein n=1 Tax=Paenibacillus mucilaginosus (strain KNP414) TaxID=1036673 RepID=F8FEG0_PAEMK|nr:hypothetical protein KNP414_06035 [Paenibacillus mucilaginosus KNP414]